MSLTIYVFLLQSSSHEVPIVEPIIEENLDIMVDLNQIGNPEDSSDSSNPNVSKVENPVDSPCAVPETLLSESLETPIPQVKYYQTLS